MLEFVKIMTRSKSEYSKIKIAVIEMTSNGKEDAIIPIKMKHSIDRHSELVVATIRELSKYAEIYLLPNTEEAVNFIIKNKIPIVNMSLSSSGLNRDIEIKLAEHAFLVTSGGNEGEKGETGAARQHWWCAVGAINRKRFLQPYSSYGLGHIKTVMYAGERINGINFHGTSAAAPIVTVLLSQWFVYYKNNRGRYPNVTETYKFIENYSEDIGEPGKDDMYGFGALALPQYFSDYCLFEEEIKIEKTKMTLKDLLVEILLFFKNRRFK